MYHLYILECADGTLYTGVAADLERRVKEHNGSAVGAKYTRARRPVRVVFAKRFRDRAAALRAEFRVKKLSRREKLKMIARSAKRRGSR
ncbi:GIY-YIG nuclease family protein [Candidatus Uhrbacteria bacterium]|nr:GIY-YIG nuclease family protein [Candidatus Uhrbacteria bacterium]